ncbi:MAG TPA: YjbQ family protein [Rhizobiales bacterium]|nr:YjbQ family protein [Hyphomicrobiales bacterium]
MALEQESTSLHITTRGEGAYEFTDEIQDWLSAIQANEGMLTLFIRHTSASLTIQENADPDVRHDLVEALDRLAPQNAPYRHVMEGPDDMPAHIKSAITGVDLTIPVRHGAAVLGTWQGVYVLEHRRRQHRREIALHFLGSLSA